MLQSRSLYTTGAGSCERPLERILPQPFRLITFLTLILSVNAACTQFATNGSISAYYDVYRFYDFRALTSTKDTPSVPATFDDGEKQLSTVSWSSNWKAVSWFRPSSKPENSDMQYIASSVSIKSDPTKSPSTSTYLSLSAQKLANGTQLAAELDYTEHNVTYASIRVMARVCGASGAVAGIFTYFNDTSESDIEIRTRDPSTQVHFSNQPTTNLITTEPIPDATFNRPVRDYGAWNVYRLDWIHGRSAWYINGVQSASTEVNVPETPSTIILNMWSNGGDFSGEMQPGSEARFEVQWIELLYNTTAVAAKEQEGEAEVCTVESSPGSPVPLVGPNVQRSTRNKAAGGRCSWSIGASALVTFLWGFFLI